MLNKFQRTTKVLLYNSFSSVDAGIYINIITSQFNFQSVNWVFNFCGQVYHVEEKLFTPPDVLIHIYIFIPCSFLLSVLSRISERYVHRTHDNDQIEMRSFLFPHFFEGSQRKILCILRFPDTFCC